ncbi:MAG TPA: DUF1800 domain-containing protein [Chloroflexota bacterium]|nr:DUF1800 domain-containing protein [Chloroflexota bacterium]
MADLTAHLLRRAGFGAGPDELARYQQLGYAAAVDKLVNYSQIDNSALENAMPTLDLTQRGVQEISAAWLQRMLHTARPLEEKMTLFWHGHFATGDSKVQSAALMWQQNGIFRANAAGNFHDLLLGVSKDPAMLKWLDGNENHKRAPNENYGRELMELFTLGIGNYTEDDVHAAARAFTGWHAPRGVFQFNARDHDSSAKTFLGQTGPWDGGDILNIILQQPAHATFLMTKLYKFFVDPNPSSANIQKYADLYTQNRYELAPVLQAMYMSPEFQAQSAVQSLIKSPAEYLIGAFKHLGIGTITKQAPGVLTLLGQQLFNPPNVAGWPGGPSWINTGTILNRYNEANRLVTARSKDGTSWTPPADLSSIGSTADQIVDYYSTLLLGSDITATTRAALIGYLNGDSGFSADAAGIDERLRGLVHLTMISPTYSLN